MFFLQKLTENRWSFLAWNGLMLYLLLIPGGNGPSWFDFIPHFDKIAHFSLFGVWAFLLGGFYNKELLPFWNFTLPYLGFALLWAITTEFLQYLTGYRTADKWDVLADICGAWAGLVMLFILKKRFSKTIKYNNRMNKEMMKEAIRLSLEGMRGGQGGPFGAVVVKDGKIVGRGNNMVLLNNDPTAHAEVTAIRDACQNLGTFQLDGCELYTSCEPCPMCLGAIYWARPDRIYFACTRKDAADIGFDDDFIYHEIEKPIEERAIPTEQFLREEAIAAFQEWDSKGDKELY